MRRRIGKIKPKNSLGYPRIGSEQILATRPPQERAPLRRGNTEERARRQAGRGGPGSLAGERARAGHGRDTASGAARAQARARPTQHRARGSHSHLADELLAEVGAAPVSLGPGHVHGRHRERLPPPPPPLAAALGLRRGTAAPPLPAHEGSREMKSRRQLSRDLPARCEALWEM